MYKKAIWRNTALLFQRPELKAQWLAAALEKQTVSQRPAYNALIFLPQTHSTDLTKPHLKIDVVRSADMNKTPDMRTRAYLPRWCAEVDIAYVQPTLSAFSIVSLLTNAGAIVGIGDFDRKKGRGSFGTFQVTSEDSMGAHQSDWDDLMKEGRGSAGCFDNPEFADEQTEDLMQFIEEERARRDITLVA